MYFFHFVKTNPQIIADYGLDRNFIQRHSDNKVINTLLDIPVSPNFGNSIIPIICDIVNGVIVNIPINIHGKSSFNLLDKICNSNNSKLLESIDFKKRLNFSLFYASNSRYYILGSLINNNVIHKVKFNMNGLIVNYVTEKYLDNSLVVRTQGSLTLYIKHGIIIKSTKTGSFNPIKYKFKPVTTASLLPSELIGVIDTETCQDFNNPGLNKIYALGYKTNNQSEKIFFVDNNNSFDSIVINFVNELLTSKFNNYIFYCHNFGNYDAIFLIKVLLEYNQIHGETYDLDFIFRENTILSMTITKLDNLGKPSSHKLIIRDSYAILTEKLSKLCESFGITEQKSVFPHHFVNTNNLSYIGKTPDFSYYSDIDINTYFALKKQDWCLMEECIKYLKLDLITLYKVIVAANNRFHSDFKVDITDGLTISSLAMKLFLSRHYKNNIPYIVDKKIYFEIKQAYSGGKTEVLIPYGENLFYYDINSSYSYASLQDMIGLNYEYVKYFYFETNIHDCFGFFFCEIESYNNYLCLLPVRNSDGIFFKGK